MPCFIRTSIGRVNLDLVLRVDDRADTTVLITAAGDRLQCDLWEDIENYAGQRIVPPAPGSRATVIYVSGEELDKTVEVLKPILGWRDFGDYRQPVFLQDAQ